MNKVLIVSESIYPESEKFLVNSGFSLVKLPSQNISEKPVSSHPDMFIAKIGECLFCDCCVHELFTSRMLTYLNVDNLIQCDRGVDIQKNPGYPYNIGFNCVNVGDKLICNRKYTCKTVLDYAQNNGIEILDVKQGYAKCSTCVVSDNAIITEDDSIAKHAVDNGIDVLKIEKGYVKLDGYDYGFIGGCSGLIEKNMLAFNGSISLHPQYYDIMMFCKKHNVEIINLCDRELFDIGTIFRII